MAGTKTLPIRMLINVNIDSQPNLLSGDNFNRLCIIGSSTNTRGTSNGIYYSLDGVAEHYATTTNEYKLASKLFAQSPKPRNVMIATVEGIVYPPAV